MASGFLGKSLLAANADTKLYTVPASTVTTATVSICNTGTINLAVRLAVVAAGVTSPAGSDYLEFDVLLSPSGVLERTGIAMSAGEQLFVRASAPAAARAHGFEEVA